MGLPNEYNRALRRHAGFYAAWFPIAAPFRIGDYGLIQDGVLQKVGHLDDVRGDGFDVEIRTTQGPPVAVDFLSEGARVVRTVAGGQVADLGPAGSAAAKLTYEFDRENAFVVKSAEVTVEQMDNVHEVARRLAALRAAGRWSHRYRVVSKVYTGVDCLVLLSTQAQTRVEFEAEASALAQLDGGRVSVKPGVTFSSDTVLKSVGASGVLGLGLFKLKWLGGSDPEILSVGEADDASGEVEEDWGDEVESDL